MSDDRLFIRRYLGQRPGDPPGAQLPASPDLIPVGTTPVSDPSRFATRQSYDTQPPVQLVADQQNFVYLRVLNSGGAARGGRLWLFHVASDLALWPQLWSGDSITIAGDGRNWVDLADVPGGVVAVGLPFEWKPQQQPGVTPQQSLIAFVEQQPLSSPPRDPRPATPFGSWEQLAQWLQATPDVAWLNVGARPDPDAPTWQSTIRLTGAPDGGRFSVGVSCHDMPIDGAFAFSVPGYDAASSAIFPAPPMTRAPITDPNMGVLVRVDWRPGFVSSMTLTWWSGPTPPPPGASISPIIAIPSTLHEAPRFPLFLHSSLDGVPEPTPVVVLGNVAYRF